MSDILIKGMEMPKSCILCDLSHEDGLCPVKKDYIDRYSFETCPLVPVPPHGRLVDADRLLSERMRRTYYHLPNGDTAIPIIDVEHASTIIQASEEET